MAVANFIDSHGHFPAAYLADDAGLPLLSWRVMLLPQLERSALYERFHLDEAWDSPHNIKLLDEMPSTYRLHHIPEDGPPHTNYLAVTGPETVWHGATPRDTDFVTDGASNTILVVENVGAEIPWTKPQDLSFATMNMSLADNPANGISSVLSPPAVGLVDSSVTFIPTSASPDAIRAMLTARGGERVNTSDFQVVEDGRLRPKRNLP